MVETPHENSESVGIVSHSNLLASVFDRVPLPWPGSGHTLSVTVADRRMPSIELSTMCTERSASEMHDR